MAGTAMGHSLGLFEIFAFPISVYQSEQVKLHYAFVYDEADRVICRYNLRASALEQFDEVMKPLGIELYYQLELSKCDTWTACINDYVKEARRRATCLGFTLGAEEEQAFERMLAVGGGVDAGRIQREAALANFGITDSLPRFR
jgi:hypothetical protein